MRVSQNSAASLRAYANLLGGEVVGSNTIIAPGPHHSGKDRSLSVRFSPTAPGGFLTHCLRRLARMPRLRLDEAWAEPRPEANCPVAEIGDDDGARRCSWP
jgi:hypothetical protein